MTQSLWKLRMKQGMENARTLYHAPDEETSASRDDFDQPAKADSPVHSAAAHHAANAPRKTPTHAGLVKDHHRHKTS